MAEPVVQFESQGPSPGGVRRFVIAVAVTVVVLGGVVLGLRYWISVTSSANYVGPERLTYPENRPFR